MNNKKPFEILFAFRDNNNDDDDDEGERHGRTLRPRDANRHAARPADQKAGRPIGAQNMGQPVHVHSSYKDTTSITVCGTRKKRIDMQLASDDGCWCLTV